MIHPLLLALFSAALPAAAFAPVQEPEAERPGSVPSTAAESPRAEGLFFLEVPDLPALLKAYGKAPVVQMIEDAAVRESVVEILDSTGVEIAPAVARALEEMGLPAPVAAAPLATARGLLDQVQSASLSLSLADDAGELGDAISKTVQALMQLQELEKKVAAFTESNQGYPPGTLDEVDLPAPLRRDPWGNPFEISVDLSTLEASLTCLGADGRPGGEGFDGDLELTDGGLGIAERLVPRAVGVVVEVDFVQPEGVALARDEALGLIQGLSWEVSESREVVLGGEPARVYELRDKEVAAGTAWMLEQDRRLLVGYGAGSLERVLTAEREGGNKALPTRQMTELARHLEPQSGATVVQGWTRLEPLEELLGSLEEVLEAHGDIQIQRLPFGGDGLFRMRLDGERFVTELIGTSRTPDQRPTSNDPDLLRCIGAQPLPESLWNFVPAESIGVLATSLDGGALYEEILKGLGAKPGERPKVLAELEQRHGFSLDQDLIANIGDGFAVYLLPITGVISIPGIAIAVDLRDAERFQAGLDGLLRLLEEQAGGEFSVRFKPYRDQPLWTFSFGGSGAGGMGLAGPLSVSPSLAIVQDHLIVTLTSLRAKKEIKRLLTADNQRHRLLVGDTAPPQDATSVAYMDWPAFLEGTYEGARAALALVGGMSQEMPFDAALLPPADTFTRFFEPTVMWSHRPEQGVRATRIESSFGPETLIGFLSGGAALGLGMRTSAAYRTNEQWETPEVEEDPERAAAIARTELTLAEVATRLEVFRIETGRYPRTLAELLEPTQNFPRGYLERDDVPRDGWERDLVYRASSDGGSYTLWSLGEDGMDQGGAGDDVRVP